MATRHLSHLREAARLVFWDGKKLSKLEQKRLDNKLLDVSFYYGIIKTATLLGSVEKIQAFTGKRHLKSFIFAFEGCAKN
jgi:hypothetical protein